MTKEMELVIATLQRHQAAMEAMRALLFALIQTHPDHKELLKKFLGTMDAIADSVDPESIPMYREQLQIFQTAIHDWTLPR